MSRDVIADPAVLDRELTRRLQTRSAADPAFWDFSQLRERTGSHGLFQYPAMMVPELQGALLDDVVATDPATRTVYDPFSGSGTVLVESLTRGLSFVGGDVNPMAILLSTVKADPPNHDEAVDAYKETLRIAQEMPGSSPPQFFGRDKWFTSSVADDLGRLRLAIQRISDRRLRRFLWVCLAETVRLTSNSRTSTFKLHLYPEETLKERRMSAIASFKSVAERNARGLSAHWQRVKYAGVQPGQATLMQGPVQTTWSPALDAPDVLMTSPPYGDNKTTVPYGQHSYLPLQWIDENDIEGGIPDGLISSTAAIDSASLGGSNRDALARRDSLITYSPTLSSFLTILKDRKELLKRSYPSRVTILTLSRRSHPAFAQTHLLSSLWASAASEASCFRLFPSRRNCSRPWDIRESMSYSAIYRAGNGWRWRTARVQRWLKRRCS